MKDKCCRSINLGDYSVDCGGVHLGKKLICYDCQLAEKDKTIEKLKRELQASCEYDESWMFDAANRLVDDSNPEYQRYMGFKECLKDLETKGEKGE